MIDDGYVPLISRIHCSWTLLLFVLTGGVFTLFLAVYLSWWIHKRRGAGISIYLYAATTMLMLLASVPFVRHLDQHLMDVVATLAFVAWIFTGFVLRSELRSHYGEEFEVNPLITAVYSVYYLNYCLWAIGDGV
jgi:hypothetical protein